MSHKVTHRFRRSFITWLLTYIFVQIRIMKFYICPFIFPPTLERHGIKLTERHSIFTVTRLVIYWGYIHQGETDVVVETSIGEWKVCSFSSQLEANTFSFVSVKICIQHFILNTQLIAMMVFLWLFWCELKVNHIPFIIGFI